MSTVQVLEQDEFMFRIFVSRESKYFGQDGLFKLCTNIPSTIKTIALKESEPVNMIYCITDNHSDYISLDERIGVTTEMM